MPPAHEPPIEESWPASKTELWPIEKIIPYDKNPRTHPQEQIDLIAASMATDGVTAPILVDEAGVILYGHGRRLASLQNGFTRYPVIIARGWTDEQKRAVRIKDNQYAALSSWDFSLMRIEIELLKVADYEIPLLGFSDIELQQFDGTASSGQSSAGSLAAQFMVAPFSVLNAREGWWQERKNAWLSLGIQSEVGRGENLLKMSDTILEPDPKKRAANKANGKAL